ncbi:MAG: ATP-binding cassette domain-containing protein [Planctomycetes bacterium]|nr:ATP-binding cassette domain-containing protein [Planctomycetota bacterium]MCB9889274.1 ATP-binding cassette domain-containing protein [Planctomycetota bacterium]
MITVDNLVKQFGTIRAVDGISFKVAKGEVLGFLGPNGAGKSTTMKMLTCFLRPDSGTATLGGCDIIRDPVGVRQRIGYVPENAPLYDEMSVESFLRFMCDMRGLGSGAGSAIERVVEQCAIGNVFHQIIATLSKGYKRRVGLAQAFLHDPEILILDEPTDGLDPNQKMDVRNLISQMAQNKCIVISTHILEEVDAVCSRAIIIARGRVLADGTPAELKSRGGGTLDAYFRQITTGGSAA